MKVVSIIEYNFKRSATVPQGMAARPSQQSHLAENCSFLAADHQLEPMENCLEEKHEDFSNVEGTFGKDGTLGDAAVGSDEGRLVRRTRLESVQKKMELSNEKLVKLRTLQRSKVTRSCKYSAEVIENKGPQRALLKLRKELEMLEEDCRKTNETICDLLEDQEEVEKQWSTQHGYRSKVDLMIETIDQHLEETAPLVEKTSTNH